MIPANHHESSRYQLIHGLVPTQVPSLMMIMIRMMVRTLAVTLPCPNPGSSVAEPFTCHDEAKNQKGLVKRHRI